MIPNQIFMQPVTMDLAKKFFLQESDNPENEKVAPSETYYEKYISELDSLNEEL